MNGRLTLIFIIGMIFQDGTTGSTYMSGSTRYAASPLRARGLYGHHQGAGCRVGAQILKYMAFSEVSLDSFTDAAASRGDFGFKVSPHHSAGMAAS